MPVPDVERDPGPSAVFWVEAELPWASATARMIDRPRPKVEHIG